MQSFHDIKVFFATIGFWLSLVVAAITAVMTIKKIFCDKKNDDSSETNKVPWFIVFVLFLFCLWCKETVDDGYLPPAPTDDHSTIVPITTNVSVATPGISFNIYEPIYTTEKPTKSKDLKDMKDFSDVTHWSTSFSTMKDFWGNEHNNCVWYHVTEEGVTRAEYVTNGKYLYFSGVLFVDEATKPNDSFIMRIYADGEKIEEFEMNQKSYPQNICAITAGAEIVVFEFELVDAYADWTDGWYKSMLIFLSNGCFVSAEDVYGIAH